MVQSLDDLAAAVVVEVVQGLGVEGVRIAALVLALELAQGLLLVLVHVAIDRGGREGRDRGQNQKGPMFESHAHSCVKVRGP